MLLYCDLHDITLRAKGFFCAGTNLGAVTVETIMREAFKGLARFWSVYVCVCWVDGGVGLGRKEGWGGRRHWVPCLQLKLEYVKAFACTVCQYPHRGTIQKLKQNKISQVVLSYELNTTFERGATVEAMCSVLRHNKKSVCWKCMKW